MSQLYTAKVEREFSVDEIKRMMASLGREKDSDWVYGLINMGNCRGVGFIRVW